MKYVRHAFGFSEKSDWAWPDDDVKLLQVIDDVMGIDQIMFHVNNRTHPSHGGKVWKHRTVVQAGGACGIWPYRLAQLFEQVATFEPLDDNWKCLRANLEGVKNIHSFHGVLGSGSEPYMQVGMEQHPGEEQNAGSQQVKLGVMGPTATGRTFRTYPVYTIDQLGLGEVDAIILDLEGYELPALMGAMETINRCKPVICVEDKGLSEKFGYSKGIIEATMKEYGYRVAERMKRDVILVAE